MTFGIESKMRVPGASVAAPSSRRPHMDASVALKEIFSD
jgi:hypothetical protein